MKKLLFILVFFLPHVIRAQSVIWVSNNPNDLGLVHYANLQQAIDVAQPGDTLLVYPSALSYGSVTLNKPLAIIGAGYEMDTLLQPALEISTIKSNTTVALTVNSGGSGSYISGTTGSVQLIACSNVKVYRTYGAVRIENCNQIELISNFFAGGFAGPICLCCASVRYKPYSLLVIESSNIIISNSVFNDSVIQSGTCDSDRGSIYTDGNSTFVIVKNNIIRDDVVVTNVAFYNNIFCNWLASG